MRHALHSIWVVSTAALLIGWAGVASAQALARTSGIVTDDTGQPLKGATVRADNPDVPLRSLTATTDDKGRFAIIGLARGTWMFTAEAPGFQPQVGELNIQRTATPYGPLTFKLPKAVARPPAGIEAMTAKDLQQQLATAEDLFNQQKFEDAIGVYRGILEAAPSLVAINLQIGSAYRSLKQYDKAIAAYDSLLKAEPGNGQATVAAARASIEKGDEQAAELLLDQATKTSTSREVFYELAELKARKNQADEAARWYRRAAEADANWGKPLFKLGTIARAKGDKQAAVTAMAQVITVDPTSSEAAQAKAVLDELKQ